MIFRFLIVQLLLVSLMSAQAGDILRGGAPMAPVNGPVSYGSSSANVAQARANAKDALARTTQAIQAVKAMQAAAQSVAASKKANNLGLDPNHPGQTLPNVANGLGVGGLQVAPGVPADLSNPVSGEDPSLWVGAKLPTQTTAKGKTTVTIDQTSQQALLNWQTFNIGKDTTLNFDQSAGGTDVGKWIAFNKILDPSGSPTQILGSINAPGQVYVINQNGIIFGGASQVNVHTLVASSLPINDNLVSRGLLNNPDYQFLFSQDTIPILSGGSMPTFTPAAPMTPNGQDGDVVVQKGASLSSPTTADHVGGRIALIGANVDNAGTISTPDGQAILAAGLQVGLQSHSTNDASLRGLDVLIGDVGSYGGTATNSGLINAPRADVTIAGKNVLQLGAIDSSTSVSLNGRIDLLANYNTAVLGSLSTTLAVTPQSAGQVVLGQGSVTQILPELASTETIVGTQLALSSQVNIQGNVIHLASQSNLLAPNATVNLQAGSWLPNPSSSIPGDVFTLSNGQIYLDAGASINAAGTVDVSAPMSENILSVQLRGAELADSTLQRFGALRGQTITLDIRQAGIYNGNAWIGTPLADASGYLGLIQRTVGELTTAGGSINFSAGDSVVMQPGSSVDVSGGWINYQGGMVQTTRVTSDGHIYDISQATPDRVYDGIYNGQFTESHPKWGVASTFSNPLVSNAHYEAGYIFGENGGSISISAPSMALDGSLLGSTVAGARQRTIAAKPASLGLSFQAQNPSTSHYFQYSPYHPTVVFSTASDLKPADTFSLDSSGAPLALRSDRQEKVVLSPNLLSNEDFGILSINTPDGDIVVPGAVAINGPAITYLDTNNAQQHGSLSLSGANIDIEGAIKLPSGNMNFTTFNISPSVAAPLLYIGSGVQAPAANPDRGDFTLGSSASLSAQGLVADDRSASTESSVPLVLQGGSISINSFNTTLDQGSALDVSGGVQVSAKGKKSFGQGGSIAISAGRDSTLNWVLGGSLTLGADLRGYSGIKGGTLALDTTQIQVGGAASAGTLLLQPDFFTMGGFSGYELTGHGKAIDAAHNVFAPGVLIAPGTTIHPTAEAYLALTEGNAVELTPYLQPEGVRTPVSLSLNANSVNDKFQSLMLLRGDIVIGENSTVQGDPGAKLTLNGDTVSVLGSLLAPGGSISITGASSFPLTNNNPPTVALSTVFLGSHSFISTAGQLVLVPNALGYRTGSVFSGGNITVSGNIVALNGAVLDVSGASGILDLSPSYSADLSNQSASGGLFIPTRVDSNGGTIALLGSEELFTDATLLGNAGGASAVGGNLVVSSGRFYQTGASRTSADINLIVTQNGQTIPVPSEAGVGTTLRDSQGNLLAQMGHFSADKFQNGGFDSLTLGGNVEFSGPVSIAANGSLTIGTGGIVQADSGVNLSAPYVKLGQPFQTPQLPGQNIQYFTQTDSLGNTITYYPKPTFGTGNISVQGGLVDVGNISFQNIGSVSLSAPNGDVRGNGTMDVQGAVTITAGQIYPTTAGSFTIAAYDYDSTHLGTITITRSGDRQLPYSAGGQLNLYASVINQGGVLRAPFGSINLGWNGSGAGAVDALSNQTVPVTQDLTLGAGSITSISAIDPLTGKAVLLPYGLNLNDQSWIDPAGNDITVSGLPSKTITISANTVNDLSGAQIDIRGGGDLYAYRWISGQGGTKDLLASTTSFAIIPGYQADYAPYAPFNPNPGATNLGGDPGYVNKSISVGDRIYLNENGVLAAGYYTLLPARYALLPGAFLVSQQSGLPTPAVTNPDGSVVVAGYRFNSLSSARIGQPLNASFEIDSSAVVRARAQYGDYLASNYLSAAPSKVQDSGRLVLSAINGMTLRGALAAQSLAGGRGGLVDISSPVDILISGPKASASGFSGLVIDSSELSGFGAASLLVGGLRNSSADSSQITVATGNLTVDNAGAPLTGSDIILAASKSLTLNPGSEIQSAGDSSVPDKNLVIQGNGTLLRVSADSDTTLARSGVTSSNGAQMSVGANVTLSGNSVTLDSSDATAFDPAVRLNANSVTLNSGQVTLQLNNPGSIAATAGLVLADSVLQQIQSNSKRLTLQSYSSIDIYGNGQIGSASFDQLTLHAAEIRGFNTNGGEVKLAANTVVLDNSVQGSVPGATTAPAGTLTLEAGTVVLGANQLKIDQFSLVNLNASQGILGQGSGGLFAQSDLSIVSPIITGAALSDQTLSAGGALTISTSTAVPSTSIAGGLGAKLSLVGASIADNGTISLPSGSLTLHSTQGDLVIGNQSSSLIDVSGQARSFFDAVKYSDGGEISLVADIGNINLADNCTLVASAPSAKGNAGKITISAPNGTFATTGKMQGAGGTGGQNGTFVMDVGSVAPGGLDYLNANLNSGGFTQSRSFRVRLGDVVLNGVAQSHEFNLSADAGSISVQGTIDGSGAEGGAIALSAFGNLTLLQGSVLTVAGQDFSSAGKGGLVTLDAGSQTNGVVNPPALLDIQTGSTIDLSVAANSASSALYGDFTGKLHLRAPQTSNSSDVQINPINGQILNASAIEIEGYKLYDLTASGGAITSTVQNSIKSNGQNFVGTAGNASATYIAMHDRLLANNSGLDSVTVIEPGAEIINRTGDLTLGTASSTATSDWSLSSFRFGPKSAAGFLTMRAAGNLNFYNALSDGFAPVTANANNGNSTLWLAPLMANNSLLPVNAQSWSFNLTAGADLTGAGNQDLLSLDKLAAGKGSLLLGKNAGNAIASNGNGGSSVLTSSIINNHFQVIRTGAGDINVAAGRDVELLNQFATIYTAGTQVAAPTTVFSPGDFSVPLVSLTTQPSQGQLLGAAQQRYFAQYSLGGGDVNIFAQADITHLTKNSSGNLVPDSERELPTNWLYRRGYVDPATGLFGLAGVDSGGSGTIRDPSGSTTWWVDYSNFFEGIGALGGGNVSLSAGHNVSNVDAVVPTNARMPGLSPSGNLAPDASKLLELGGGNLRVQAGNNIDGGIYYVERGNGRLFAGGDITTNSTRSPSMTNLPTSIAAVDAPESWLPTTLFLGKGNFDVSARGNVLIGPMVNSFLQAPGLNNKFYYKTYFSTYDPNSAVDVASLGGDVTFRESATIQSSPEPLLWLWEQQELLLANGSNTAAYYQPWLRLAETSVQPFATVSTLAPPTIRATAFLGDLNVIGNLNLFPSSTGDLQLTAAGSINGLQPTGIGVLTSGANATVWTAAQINLSDANPSNIPGIASPFAYQSLVGRVLAASHQTQDNFLSSIDIQFAETGSADGVIQTKQALHAPGLLHLDDPNPLELYSSTGSISGLTLFSAKAGRVLAGQDITDIGLYLQNLTPSDMSVVSAGRDLIAYDANSPLRVAALSPGNTLPVGQSAQSGDIQISGPGTLEVLAGGNLDLGNGANNTNGTGMGITSIGNARNPYLPYGGADIVAAAGYTPGATQGSAWNSFISQYIEDPVMGTRYLSELGELPGITGSLTPQSFLKLSAQDQQRVATAVFFLVLRDSGRDHNNPASPTFGTYAAGLSAINTLFASPSKGDISLAFREIKTRNGGNIELLAPGGGVKVGLDIQMADQGILTEGGGNISVFADQSVSLGRSRIFTLRGGDIMIWSSQGDIAAGSSAKTVQSAPPTRVLIDPQSGDVVTDLSGLATGGGIGVLATVAGIPPGSVDLIAVSGAIDAGDAGIRSTGNLNLAAVQVLNASNIQASGASMGVPVTQVSAPNISGISAASNAAAASTNTASQAAQQQANRNNASETQDVPSIITAEVIGYGGGEGDGDVLSSGTSATNSAL